MIHPRAEDRQLCSLSVPEEGGSLSPRAFRGDYVIEDHGYETPCWIWQKTLNQAGYGTGSFTGAGITTNYAHRAYYVAAYGLIDDGAHIHHRCENPPCVNPTHLEVTVHALHLAYHKQEASSLTWDDVREIRAAFKAGAAQRTLGKQYGIAQPTLSDIITNTTWKDASYKPGRPAVCALEECGADFLAERSNQRFCCFAHGRLWNSRRTNRRARGVPLDGPSKWKRAA